MDTLEGIITAARTQEIESAYRKFFENSRDLLFILAADGPDAGRIILANEAAAALHGYTLEEFQTLNVRVLDSPKDKQLYQNRITRILGGETLQYEVVHICKDGSLLPLEVSSAPLWMNGRPYVLSIHRDTSEKRAAEQLVRDREKFVDSIAQASPDIIYVYDLEGRRNIYSNRRVAEILGYQPEEMQRLGKGFFHFLLHPEDDNRLPTLHTRWENAKDGEVLETEYRMKHKSGEWRWFIGRETVFKRNEQGKVVQLVGTAQDITGRKNTELALAQSNSVLNASLESTEDGILVVDRNRKIAAYNKTFLTLWGIPDSLAEEKDDFKLLDFAISQLADPEKFLERVNELYERWSLETEDVVELKDGRVFERYSKPQWIGNEVAGRVWSFRDVTARIQREKTLRESEERFKRLQEASFGGIGIYDHGRIIDANHGLANITGYDIEELIGMDGLLLVAPEYREHVIQKIRADYELPYDVIGVKKDGTRFHMEVHGKSIPFNNKTVRVTEIRDVSARKQIEESVREQNVRLTSIADNLTRKNAQLEEFTQIVSHNLRAPAGNIRSLLSLLEQANPDEQKEYLKHLQETSGLLLNTLNHLNDVLRIKQDRNVERQDLIFQDVFDNVFRMLRAKIEELDASIIADFDQVPDIHYPVIYLESIMLNLIGNALKYHSPKRKPIIRISTYRKGKFVFMEVGDNGLGIDLVKYGHQMFKMRKTFHFHPEGQGLGLFLIKNQIEAMGGEITIQSEVNKGATFFVNFNKYETA